MFKIEIHHFQQTLWRSQLGL